MVAEAPVGPSDDLAEAAESPTALGLGDESAAAGGAAAPGVDRMVPDRSASLRILDADGRALVGAQVTLNALDNDVLGFFAEDRWTDWLFLLQNRTERLLTSAVTATSDERGDVRLELSELPEAGGWVIWATHPEGVAARWMRVGEAAWPSELRLERGRGAGVQVIGAASGPVRVVQQAMLIEDGGSPKDPERLVRRALVRVHEWKAAAGTLNDLGGRQMVWAEQAGRRSAPMVIDGTGAVELVLGEAFELEVRASGIDGAELGPWATLAVRAVMESGEQLVAVHAYGAAPDESLSVPLVADATGYAITLGMGDNVHAEQHIALPAPREHVIVELEFRAGINHWMGVFREAAPDGAIAGAAVRYEWDDPILGSGSRRATSTDGGWAYLVGVPVGVDLHYRIDAPGYAPRSSAVFRLAPDDADQALQAFLVAGAPLRVRVLRDGEPVAVDRFGTWPIGAQYVTDVHRDVELDADGWHRIPGVPLEASQVVALGLRGPLAPPVALRERGADGSFEAVIELGSLTRASGRVLDARTGDPIEGARIEPVIQEGGGATVAVGAREAVSTGSDGEFAEEVLLPGVTLATARADGYTGRWIQGTESDGVVEFGDILMEPVALLSVQLEGEDAGGFEQYHLVPGVTRDTRAGVRFDAGGRAVVEAPAGTAQFGIAHPSGAWDTVQWPGPLPQGELTLGLVTDELLEVLFVDAAGAPVEVDGVVWARFMLGGALVNRVKPIPFTAASDSIPAPPPGAVELTWGPTDGSFGFGRAVVQFETGRTPPVEIQVKRADATRFRVTDSAGNVAVGAQVVQRIAGGGRLGRSATVTNAEGDACAAFEDAEPMQVAVMGADRSISVGHSIGPREPGAEVPIEMAAPHPLQIRVTGASEPLSGARVAISASAVDWTFDWLDTDAEGRVERSGVGPGSYRLKVEASGFFPRELSVAVPTGEVQVDLRAVGALRIEAELASGEPAAGAAIAVTSLEGLGSLAEWRASGWVEAGADRLGGDGVLVLDGLPAGAVTVEVEGFGRAELTVIAGEEVVVALPE